jgi:hypothetical protein
MSLNALLKMAIFVSLAVLLLWLPGYTEDIAFMAQQANICEDQSAEPCAKNASSALVVLAVYGGIFGAIQIVIFFLKSLYRKVRSIGWRKTVRRLQERPDVFFDDKRYIVTSVDRKNESVTLKPVSSENSTKIEVVVPLKMITIP